MSLVCSGSTTRSFDYNAIGKLNSSHETDPTDTSERGVNQAVDTRSIDPDGEDLGRAVAHQELRQFGFTDREARLWMNENPEWRTRLSNGDGRALSDDEMRALVRRGWIHSSIKLDAVRLLQQFRSRWDVRAMSTSMSAPQRSDEEWMVRTTTNALDTLTETLPRHLGDPINRFGVGLTHGLGSLAALSSGLQRTLHDGMRALTPAWIGRQLSAADERHRRLVEALQGAQSGVTAEDSMSERVAAAAGIEVPRIARFARQLPLVAGEVAPKAVIYLPIIAATGGMGAPASILINAGLGSADAYLSSRGQGEDLATSAHTAVLGALQSGLLPLAGRYGVAPGIVTNLAATYAVGKAQGLSEHEIERNMLQTLVQEGAFQTGRLRSGHEAAAATLTADVRSIVERVRKTSANEAASRVYRVQGGTAPKASRTRVVIGENGELQVRGDDMLFVTFDDAGRAHAFRNKNRPGGEIISFEVNPQFVRKLRSSAVAESFARSRPHAPIKVDSTKTNGSFGLPAHWINQLVKAARPGTERMER